MTEGAIAGMIKGLAMGLQVLVGRSPETVTKAAPIETKAVSDDELAEMRAIQAAKEKKQ
jgi:hypothetical protein